MVLASPEVSSHTIRSAELVDAGLELAETYGFYWVHHAHIGMSCKVSKATVFRYLGDKLSLRVHLLDALDKAPKGGGTRLREELSIIKARAQDYTARYPGTFMELDSYLLRLRASMPDEADRMQCFCERPNGRVLMAFLLSISHWGQFNF